MENNNIIINPQTTGAVQIEQSRVMAEVLAATQAAKAFPRDEAKCKERILSVCGNTYFAEKAMYSIPAGGGNKAEGLSIRAAEQFATYWGNLNYGVTQLQSDGKQTEFYIFCVDLENNVRSTSTVTVSHFRKSGNNVVEITDPKMLQDHLKAKTAIILRERILSVLPQYVIHEATQIIKKTIIRDLNAIDISKIIAAFKELNVSKKQVLNYLDLYNEKDIKGLNIEKYRELQTIYMTLKDDVDAKPDLFFPSDDHAAELPPPPPPVQ